MEIKVRCPRPSCNRCVGIFNATDPDTSTLKVTEQQVAISNPERELYFHCTCPKCKKEVHIIMGLK